MTDLPTVVAIARTATAHNAGLTILRQSQATEGGPVTLQMSSWPRVMEASKELRRSGYEVYNVEGDIIEVTFSFPPRHDPVAVLEWLNGE